MSTLPEFLTNLRQDLVLKQTPDAAWAIMEEYIGFFGKEGVDNDLWQLLVGALSSDELDAVEKGHDRHNLIFFYEYTVMFPEAVEFLTERRKEKSNRLKHIRRTQNPDSLHETFSNNVHFKHQ